MSTLAEAIEKAMDSVAAPIRYTDKEISAVEMKPGVPEPITAGPGVPVQYTQGFNGMFIPAAQSVGLLPPGYFDIGMRPDVGLYYQRLEVGTGHLLRFPHSSADEVIAEIQKFWEREHIFRRYGMSYRRGILMYGPAGSGKSSTIRLVMQDVIERGGIVLRFTEPGLFRAGYRTMRQIQPTTPVVAIMEDIDALIKRYDESDMLNILDGVDHMDRIVFVATTNYPEMLDARIANRPSRFDRRVHVGKYSAEAREMYLLSLADSGLEFYPPYDLARWVRDTEGFSLAHLKELFTAFVVFGYEYETALKTVRDMGKKVTSDGDREMVGFGDRNGKGYSLLGRG